MSGGEQCSRRGDGVHWVRGGSGLFKALKDIECGERWAWRGDGGLDWSSVCFPGVSCECS